MLGHEVYLANDADCLAVSEARDGAAAGAANVFAVILGTGVGGGIAIGGRLLRRANAIAGEWGHNPLPWIRAGMGGAPRRRVLVRTPWLHRDLAVWRGSCAQSRARDCLAAFRRSHRAARRGRRGARPATLSRYEDRLARALAHVINLLDPDVIVLGGGVSRVERLYRTVPTLWDQWVFSDGV